MLRLRRPPLVLPLESAASGPRELWSARRSSSPRSPASFQRSHPPSVAGRSRPSARGRTTCRDGAQTPSIRVRITRVDARATTGAMAAATQAGQRIDRVRVHVRVRARVRVRVRARGGPGDLAPRCCARCCRGAVVRTPRVVAAVRQAHRRSQTRPRCPRYATVRQCRSRNSLDAAE